MKQPILFLTLPHVALFQKKSREAVGILMGPCILAGVAEQVGFETDMFDLNVALNDIRSTEILASDDVEKLMVPQKFHELYRGNSPSEVLDGWVEKLADMLPQKKYLTVCLSLDRQDAQAQVSKASFSFAVLFAKKLKERYGCPVLAGGVSVIKIVGKNYIDSVLEGANPHPIDKISWSNVSTSFGKFLLALNDGLPVHSPEADALFHVEDPFWKSSQVVPRFRQNNEQQLLVSATDMLPAEFLKKYPKAQEIEPFYIAPYRLNFGCPYTCAFCPDGGNKSFSQTSVHDLLDVFCGIVKQGVTNFRFYDNNINLNQGFLDSLSKGMKEAALKIQFSDSANLIQASPALFQQLSEMGARKLWFGSESLSDRLLELVGKKARQMTIASGMKAAHDAGIWVGGNFIFNLPTETDEEFQETLDFIANFPYLDAMEYNEYRMIEESLMFENPEKYGMRKRAVADNGRVAAFDEIGGLSWEEKRAKGQEKARRLDVIPRKLNYTLARNDYLLYGLRGVGYSKVETRAIFEDLADWLVDTNQEKAYQEFHKNTIPYRLYRHYFPDLSTTTIDGNDLTKTPTPSTPSATIHC